MIDEESAADIFALVDYWADEPPAHVILGWRYLGDKSGPGAKKAGPTQAEALKDMGQLAQMLGQPARPLPPHLKQLIDQAEALKKAHKGV